ncbi:DUF445 domain-containing protein [Aureibacillus halotolerans]|uniref:Uncharacterized membrane protein YheB (UPF0754 family) n=1 Tax=Aureibacillus halotolerans TaxID=1508390 RepID=A0A4R6TUR3_9BACI|nr:DUF445 family protein [Aureibacillus halotolerans]TDQ35404.1 uncharacterized membrane protein YheB (UPF0754 family) [Aureibacillus halotolerans]
MDTVILFSFMAFVGAAVGGATNYLAIKMLFRPFHPIYIGSWRLPFTPGLIPKRREEMAKSFGKTVAEHLVTPKQFLDLLQQEKVTDWMEAKGVSYIDEWAHEQMTVQQLGERFGINLQQKAPETVQHILQQHITTWWRAHSEESIGEVLPEKWKHSIEDKIPEVSAVLLQKGITWLESDQGKEDIRHAVNDFFDSHHRMFGMVQMLFGQERLEDRIQQELVGFMKREQMRPMVQTFVEKEWRALLQKPLTEVEKGLSATAEEIIPMFAKDFVEKWPWERWLQQPVATLLTEERVISLKKLWRTAYKRLFAYVVEHLQTWFSLLKLHDIVEKQVSAYPVQRLEELVLGISKRELSMITYLGAFLGGLIGLVQALFVLIFPL